MASVDGVTAQKMQEILDQTVESAEIEGATLTFTRHDGSTFPAGDFSDYVDSQLTPAVEAATAPIDAALASIPTQIETEIDSVVPAAVAGGVTNKLNITGGVTFGSMTPADMVNRLFTATVVGNITIDANNFPSPAIPGTQFAMVLKQDSTGGRTLTLLNIKRSQGALALSTAAGAIDIIMFLFDGTTWYAGAMGVAFS